MNITGGLVLLTTGTAGLGGLGFITGRAASHLQRLDQASSTSQAEAQMTANPAPVTLPPVPDEATASYYWQRLLTPGGMFGLFAGAVCEVPLLAVNSDLVARTLETVFDRFGNPIFPLMLYGLERTITDFDLIAGLISISQMLAASALRLSWEARKRQWGICGLSLVALGSLISFETGAAVYRAFKIDPHVSNALLSAGAALGISSVECIVGVFAIDRFLLPLSLALLWTVGSPIRGLGRWWRKRQATRARRGQPQRQRRPHPVTLALAGLDHAVMAPLRRLDAAVSAMFSGKVHCHKEMQHEEAYADPKSEEPYSTRHGHDAGRVAVE